MWREYARYTKHVGVLFLYGGTSESVGTTGARFRKYGLFQSARGFVSHLFRCWKREVIVLDWPENSSSGLVSPYEIRR
jgi:hypothetical protein